MKTTFFLVFDENGIQKMNKQKKPALKSGHRGVKMEVEIPDVCFNNPFPTVSVEFDEDALITPSVSATLKESKAKFREHFYESFEALTEPRQEYVREQVWGVDADMAEFIFDPDYADPETFSLEDISRAVEIVVRHEQEKPDLPPGYEE